MHGIVIHSWKDGIKGNEIVLETLWDTAYIDISRGKLFMEDITFKTF